MDSIIYIALSKIWYTLKSMDNTRNMIISSVVVAVVVIILIVMANYEPAIPKPQGPEATSSQYSVATSILPEDMALASFATCLADKGVSFYGAFWCPHCQNQKDEFRTAQKQLPYIECSTPEGSSLSVCTEKQIRSYPTWINAQGERLEGEQSLETLAEFSSCPVPVK